MTPFRYRDFWDVPRMVVVSHGGRTYLLDSPFDDELDDYPDTYTVYELPGEPDDWTDLAGRGRRLGTVPVASVHFDPTRRAALDASVLDRL